MLREEFVKSLLRRFFLGIKTELSGITEEEAEQRMIAFSFYHFLKHHAHFPPNTYVQSALYLVYSARTRKVRSRVGIQGSPEVVEFRLLVRVLGDGGYHFSILTQDDRRLMEEWFVVQRNANGRYLFKDAQPIPANVG